MLELANTVSELKSTNSKKGIPASPPTDGSTEPTNTDISLHHSDSLQCGQTSSANHAPFEAGLSSPSLSDTSLRELLCSSTPIHDDRMGRGQFLSQSNPIDGHNHQINREQYDHLDKEIALVKVDTCLIKDSQNELHERVTKLEEFCVENSKFHAKNANRISRLERKSVKTEHVSTVPCHNRYAALTELCNDDDADHSNGEQERARTPPMEPTTERQKTRLTIVGSSMVRGLGQMVSSDDIDSCCFTNPGAKTDHIKGKIGQLTRPTDDVILLQIGSNNIPDDPVLTLIDKLDDVIDEVRQMRPLSQVIVAPIPLRIDSLSYLNNEIKRVNEFIRDKCSKDENLHFLYQGFTYNEYSRDGLHLNRNGKALYAQNVRRLVRQIISHNR